MEGNHNSLSTPTEIQPGDHGLFTGHCREGDQPQGNKAWTRVSCSTNSGMDASEQPEAVHSLVS